MQAVFSDTEENTDNEKSNDRDKENLPTTPKRILNVLNTPNDAANIVLTLEKMNKTNAEGFNNILGALNSLAMFIQARANRPDTEYKGVPNSAVAKDGGVRPSIEGDDGMKLKLYLYNNIKLSPQNLSSDWRGILIIASFLYSISREDHGDPPNSI